jgi:hypothetical protein
VAMYICPNCEELNEEHRNYCKQCGTWLLNTHYPPKRIEDSKSSKRLNRARHNTAIHKTVNIKWLKIILYILIGTAIPFLSILILSAKGNTQQIFEYVAVVGLLYGFIGLILTLVIALVYLFSKRTYATGKHVLWFLISSLGLLIFSIVTLSDGQRTSNQSVYANASPFLNRSLSNELTIYGLKLGDTEEQVIGKIGMPSDKEEQKLADDRTVVSSNYPKLQIAYIDGKMAGILTTDAEYKTKHGIGIGSTFNDAKKAYLGYELYTNESKDVLLVKDNNNIVMAFEFDNQQVRSIVLSKIDSLLKGNEQQISQMLSHGIKIRPDGTYEYPEGVDIKKDITYYNNLVRSADFQKSAQTGRIPGIPFTIGVNMADIKKKWGNPIETGGTEGGMMFQYKSCFFLTGYPPSAYQTNQSVFPSVNNDGQSDEPDVLGIGIPISMNVTEIKKIFGPPTYEGDNIESGGWNLIYNKGSYQFDFHGDDNGHQIVTYVVLAKKSN